jgi:simple sugar transport system ATP-binding protein
MVGHAVDEPERRPTKAVGDVVCALTEVSTPAGVRERLDKVSLTLHAGEIVAIAGVSGNGQAALAELLCGVRAASSGRVTLQSEPFPATPAKLSAAGVARIPEDRHAVGVVGDLPVWENAVSERLRSRAFAFGPFVRRGTARQHAQRVIEAFDVRGAGPLSPARSLSGGNMQKLILGRALLAPEGNQTDREGQTSSGVPDDRSEGPLPSKVSPLGGQRPAERRSVGALIVAHQPTWGLDIGAVSYVQQQLIAARDAGAAVLLISDDLDEVMTLGDRIAVMHHGHLSEALPAEAWTRESIGLAMAGHGEPHAA